MNTQDLHPASISLKKGQIVHLRKGVGQRVESLTGTVWITIDNDLRDILVATGEGFTIDRSGETLINALEDACLLVLEPTGAH